MWLATILTFLSPVADKAMTTYENVKRMELVERTQIEATKAIELANVQAGQQVSLAKIDFGHDLGCVLAITIPIILIVVGAFIAVYWNDRKVKEHTASMELEKQRLLNERMQPRPI